ncbi:MAG: hypothetical protein IKZ58_05270 [Selenomonadaceae bacterium]|nr:hypothetical protein [Selenomonadaceae bacterium]
MERKVLNVKVLYPPRDIVSGFKTIAKIFVLTAAIVLVTNASTFAFSSQRYSFGLLNHTGKTITEIWVSPSSSVGKNEICGFTGFVKTGESDFVSFDSPGTSECAFRVMFSDGSDYTYAKVNVSKIDFLTLNHDGTIDYN